jgi:hypothetical protein
MITTVMRMVGSSVFYLPSAYQLTEKPPRYQLRRFTKASERHQPPQGPAAKLMALNRSGSATLPSYRFPAIICRIGPSCEIA